MKALTVQQPYAWAIIHGGKDVENRSQAWSYRGPLAIHAGARWSERGGHSPLVASALLDAREREGWRVRVPSREETIAAYVRQGIDPRTFGFAGHLLGVVDLVDVHEARMLDEESGCCDPWGEQTWQGRSQLVHLVLANPRPLDRPIPCRGRLGLWTPPPDVLDELREAL